MKILFVGSHVDDIELFGGATLSRFKDQSKCFVLSSHHEKSMAECLNSFRDIYGLSNDQFEIANFGICNNDMLLRNGEIRELLEKYRDTFSPEVVITNSPLDTNQDHKQVAEEVIRVFKCTSTILHGEFLNNDVGDQEKNVFIRVDYSDVKRKWKALKQYKSQHINGRRYFDRGLVENNARAMGSRIQEEFAECFSMSGAIIK